MSVSLDRKMFNEVVSLIQPHVETVQAQQGLVQTALSDADNLRSLIQYGGGARTFAVLLTRKCLDFGTLPSGEHALSAVLSEIYYRVGEADQKRIDDIQLEIEQQVDTVKGKPVVDVVELPRRRTTPAPRNTFLFLTPVLTVTLLWKNTPTSYSRRGIRCGWITWGRPKAGLLAVSRGSNRWRTRLTVRRL